MKLFWKWRLRREEKRAARKYMLKVMRPLPPATLRVLAKRLEEGTAPQCTVKRRKP